MRSPGPLGTVGLCTDSNTQLPEQLIARYGVVVVPLSVTVDGETFLEGVQLSAGDFWARYDRGTPTVSTAAPSPGQFLAAFESLAEAGAAEVLSVHVGSAVSGTYNAARLAAEDATVPVRLVDTGTASFAAGCCLWEAAEVLRAGAGLEAAARAAEGVAHRVGNVFVVGGLEVARAGGRLARGADSPPDRIPVLSLQSGAITPIGSAGSPEEAAATMADAVLTAGSALRVGVAVADTGAEPFWRALERRLQGAPEVLELVRYRVGPSVGAHTGPGTAGAVYYDTDPDRLQQ